MCRKASLAAIMLTQIKDRQHEGVYLWRDPERSGTALERRRAPGRRRGTA